MSRLKNFLLVALFGMFILCLMPKTRAVDIVDLGVFGGTSSSARAVSDDGRVVVGSYRDTSGLTRAFKWDSINGMKDLGTLGGYTVASDVSADGKVIVGSSFNGTNYQAVKWALEDEMQELGSNGLYSRAVGVSADGSTIIGSTYNPYRTPFKWTSDTGIQLFLSPNNMISSNAYGVSANGDIIVGSYYVSAPSGGSGPFILYRWDSINGIQSLGNLGGRSSYALAVSGDGSIVVGESSNSLGLDHAVRWTAEGGLEDLGALGGPQAQSWGADISSDGKIIVGVSENNNSVRTGFVFGADGIMRSLNAVLNYQGVSGISSWTSFDSVSSISGNELTGYNLVGSGTKNGQTRSFLVKGLISTVPEPKSYVLAAISTGIIAFLARRRK